MLNTKFNKNDKVIYVNHGEEKYIIHYAIVIDIKEMKTDENNSVLYYILQTNDDSHYKNELILIEKEENLLYRLEEMLNYINKDIIDRYNSFEILIGE